MKNLHPTQKKLLDLLRDNIANPLTIRELQEALSVSSPSVVHHHLRQLEKKGYLYRSPSNSHDYQILTDSPSGQKIVYLNLYGLAQCGKSGSILDDEPIEKIPVPITILRFPPNEAFLVKAKGDSMSPKIHEGDLVIAKKTSDADNGSMVVCINNGEALIKRIQKEEDKIILISSNPSYEPFLAKDDFRIEGVVKSIVSYSV